MQVINSSPGDLAPVFDAILEKAHTLCGAAAGGLVEFEGDQCRALAVHGNPRFAEYWMQQGWIRLAAPESAAPLRRGEPIQILDASSDDGSRRSEQWNRLVELSGARALLSIPLLKDYVLLGVITAFRQEVRPFSDKEIALLQNFAAQAVIAMENARLITETREALEQQTATAEVLQVINSSPGELAPVFDAILEKAHMLCGAAFGGLAIFEGGQFRAVAYHGVTNFTEYVIQPRHNGNTPLEQVVGGKQLVHVADVRTLDAYHDHSAFKSDMDRHNIRTFLVVPLRKDDVLLGAISAYRQEVRPFSHKQIALLQNFAAQAVIAMENARLLTETREALEQQTATAEVLQVINSSPGDLAPVFEAILEKAHSLCGAANGGLMTFDGEEIHVAAAHGDPRFVEAWRQMKPVRRSPERSARLMGGTLQLLDLLADPMFGNVPEYRRLADLGGIGTCLIAPFRKTARCSAQLARFARRSGHSPRSRSRCSKASPRRRSLRWRTRGCSANCTNAPTRWPS